MDKSENQEEKGAEEEGNTNENMENGGDGNDQNHTSNDGTVNSKDTSDPVGEIQGIVQGEADNNVVQSAGQFNMAEPESVKV